MRYGRGNPGVVDQNIESVICVGQKVGQRSNTVGVIVWGVNNGVVARREGI